MARTQRKETVLLFGAIEESLTLDRAFKLQVAKRGRFQTHESEENGYARKKKDHKDTEIEKPHTYVDGGIYVIGLGCQVVREETGNTVFCTVWTKVVSFRATIVSILQKRKPEP